MSVLLSVSVILALTPPESRFTPTLDKELVFLKNENILLINDKWNLIVDIDVSEYDSIINYIETVFQNFEFFINHPTLKRLIPWLEVSRLRTVANMLKTEIISLTFMLPETRKKCGAINAIDFAMKMLFGTMDSDDPETFCLSLIHI